MKIKIRMPVDPVEVEAKTLRIHCKVRDEFVAHVLDAEGNELGGQEDGYVPPFMPGPHFGDYLSLDIELDTGLVSNWRKPDPGQIADFIEQGDEAL